MNFITSQWLVSVKKHRQISVYCTLYIVCVDMCWAEVPCENGYSGIYSRTINNRKQQKQNLMRATETWSIVTDKRTDTNPLLRTSDEKETRESNLRLFFCVCCRPIDVVDDVKYFFFTHHVPCAFCHFSCLTTYFSISLANFCIRFNSGMWALVTGIWALDIKWNI